MSSDGFLCEYSVKNENVTSICYSSGSLALGSMEHRFAHFAYFSSSRSYTTNGKVISSDWWKKCSRSQSQSNKKVKKLFHLDFKMSGGDGAHQFNHTISSISRRTQWCANTLSNQIKQHNAFSGWQMVVCKWGDSMLSGIQLFFSFVCSPMPSSRSLRVYLFCNSTHAIHITACPHR